MMTFYQLSIVVSDVKFLNEYFDDYLLHTDYLIVTVICISVGAQLALGGKTFLHENVCMKN